MIVFLICLFLTGELARVHILELGVLTANAQFFQRR